MPVKITAGNNRSGTASPAGPDSPHRPRPSHHATDVSGPHHHAPGGAVSEPITRVNIRPSAPSASAGTNGVATINATTLGNQSADDTWPPTCGCLRESATHDSWMAAEPPRITGTHPDKAPTPDAQATDAPSAPTAADTHATATGPAARS